MPKSNRTMVTKDKERVDQFGYIELNVNIQVRSARRS
jgi:hypothetical protein